MLAVSGLSWLLLSRLVEGVEGQRSVTGFAPQDGVPVVLHRIGRAASASSAVRPVLADVAFLAGRPAGIGDRPGPHVVDGPGPVEAEGAEVGGDERPSRDRGRRRSPRGRPWPRARCGVACRKRPRMGCTPACLGVRVPGTRVQEANQRPAGLAWPYCGACPEAGRAVAPRKIQRRARKTRVQRGVRDHARGTRARAASGAGTESALNPGGRSAAS